MLRLPIFAASLFATSAAFAADAVLPVAVEPVVPHISGYGEIYLGGLEISQFGEDDSIRAGGGAGRVNIPFAEKWNVQLDGTYDRIWEGGDYIDGLGGAVHAYYRDPQRFAVGLFATYKRYGTGFADVNDYAVGPEAQVYFGNLTLYGQAYYGKIDLDFDNPTQWGVRGVARYFVQPNLRLDGEIAFNRIEDFGDFDTVSLAAQATYRFEGTPWSVFGRYQYDRLSFESETFSTNNNYMIGLRASFGGSTLFDEDRNGATMDTYRSNFILPFLGAS
jgi:hypothetical protein